MQSSSQEWRSSHQRGASSSLSTCSVYAAAAMTTIPLLNIFLYLSAISAVKSSNVEGCDGTKDECNPIIDRTNDSRGLKRYNGTLSEKETKEGWKQIIWSDYKKCKVHELCFDDDRRCKSGWKWNFHLGAGCRCGQSSGPRVNHASFVNDARICGNNFGREMKHTCLL